MIVLGKTQVLACCDIAWQLGVVIVDVRAADAAAAAAAASAPCLIGVDRGSGLRLPHRVHQTDHLCQRLVPNVYTGISKLHKQRQGGLWTGAEENCTRQCMLRVDAGEVQHTAHLPGLVKLS